MIRGWSSQVRPLDTERILTAMTAGGVRFVLVGGIAAIVHGWSGATFDADVVPALDTRNLNRLGRVLRSLTAEVYVDPERTDLTSDGKPPEADDFGYTAEGLRHQKAWHLTSDAGFIDIASDIDGVGGFEPLVSEASSRQAFGLMVTVASLEHIIASKRAAARPKDLRVLPELEDLLRRGDRPKGS